MPTCRRLPSACLKIGTTIQGYFYIIGPAVIVAFISVSAWTRSEQGKNVLDTLRFKVPILSEIWMKYQVAMFSRTLATLLAGGMPLVTSLETASSAINSRRIAGTVLKAAGTVREGQFAFLQPGKHRIFSRSGGWK